MKIMTSTEDDYLVMLTIGRTGAKGKETTTETRTRRLVRIIESGRRFIEKEPSNADGGIILSDEMGAPAIIKHVLVVTTSIQHTQTVTQTNERV